LANEPDLDSLLLVDDFCGTGDQFLTFMALPALTAFLVARPKCRIVYITAAAHQAALANIRAAQPRIEVIAAETLTADHHFFTGTLLGQYSMQGLKEQFLAEHQSLCETFKLGGNIGVFGYKGQGLTYAFSHGTPNNSLPILWHDANGWTPLLDR
jgi:hypothetical protein